MAALQSHVSHWSPRCGVVSPVACSGLSCAACCNGLEETPQKSNTKCSTLAAYQAGDQVQGYRCWFQSATPAVMTSISGVTDSTIQGAQVLELTISEAHCHAGERTLQVIALVIVKLSQHLSSSCTSLTTIKGSLKIYLF